MDSLTDLYQEMNERQQKPKTGSYTAYLFEKGLDKILKKVGEESTEVVIAAKNQDNAELVAESADLLYHLLVLFVQQGVSLAEIEEELVRRQGLVSQTKERRTIDDL